MENVRASHMVRVSTVPCICVLRELGPSIKCISYHGSQAEKRGKYQSKHNISNSIRSYIMPLMGSKQR